MRVILAKSPAERDDESAFSPHVGATFSGAARPRRSTRPERRRRRLFVPSLSPVREDPLDGAITNTAASLPPMGTRERNAPLSCR